MKINIYSISAILATSFCIAQNNLSPTGNIGIGTTDPVSKLTVSGSITINSGLINTSVRPPLLSETLLNGEIRGFSAHGLHMDDGFLRLSAGGGTNSFVKSYIDLSGYSSQYDMYTNIVMGTRGTERVRIDSNGNIGIGTTNPSSSLSVLGGISKLTLSGTDGVYDNFIKYGHKSDLESGTDYVNRWHGIDATISAGGPNDNKLKFKLYGGSSENKEPIDVMTLVGNGNVGIGTTYPETKLSVNGNSTIIAEYGGWAEGLNIDSPNGIWGGLKFRTVGRNGKNGNWHFGYDNVHSGATTTGNNIYLYNGSNDLYVMTYKEDGNVGIGTTKPDEKLTVKGKIHAEEVRIDLNFPAPDYVFANDYKLKSLQEVEEFIKQNSHLPEIPSAKEIEKNGLMLAEMNMSLLKKIEEMTLYMIEQEKKNNEQSKKIKEQNEKFSALEKRLEIIENSFK